MSDQTRLFLALVLSMAAIFAYNKIFVDPKIEAQKQAIEAQKLAQPQTLEVIQDDALSVEKEQPIIATELDNSIKQLMLRNQDLSNKKAGRVKIESDKLSGSINLQGAKFDDIKLKEHDVTLHGEEKIKLLSSSDEGLYFFRTGFLPAISGVKSPSSKSIWKLEAGTVLSELSPITLSWDNGSGIIFKKDVSIDENYMFEVKEYIVNNTIYPVTFAPFGLINKVEDISKARMYISHEGPIAVIDNILEEASFDDVVDEGKVKFESVSGWAGITSKYWMSAIIPAKPSEEKINITFKNYEKDDRQRFQVDFLSEKVQIAPKTTYEYKFRIYTGAKKLDILDAYESKLDIPMFDHSIDFGWLYFLTRPIFEALTYFNKLLGNFGLAILLLTVCIRVILFPIANKSYKSMARMRKHMPEIQRLKEKHSKDRQKLGQEMMKYYKSHKINPASGCLPMLIQIPVFFSLYKVLYVTIEMRHAPFYGWIKDLSASDPTNVFNLFGLLPYTLPEWLPAIGVLPLLFSLTMVLQQKLNPPPTDETQRIVMSWLPWIFLFLFASFPAGLVIYWVWNNILSIAQQYIITKRIDEDKNA